jgi:hypothetical protein
VVSSDLGAVSAAAGTVGSPSRRLTMGDKVMAFVQIIEFQTSDIERRPARSMNSGGRPPRVSAPCATNCLPVITRIPAATSLSRSSTCMSRRWELQPAGNQASAEKHMKTSEGPPVFYDLDILEDRA